jgi:dihydrodipicolinate synthase/N-acetylneuraminate lyase
MSLRGVFCAAATPLKADLSPDHDLLVEHVKRLLADGCHGVAMLGTTSEANSFSMAERKAMLEAVVKSGVDPRVLMPGTGLAAGRDALRRAAAVLLQGCVGRGAARCLFADHRRRGR